MIYRAPMLRLPLSGRFPASQMIGVHFTLNLAL
jgi:hypothetical protein